MRSNQTLKFFTLYIKFLPHLTIREKQVILGRLKRKTLEWIGGSLGLTEGRIRQIEKDAIYKIKSKKQQLQLFNNTVRT